MKATRVLLLLLMVPAGAAQAARHKSGPVDLRGIAGHVARSGFTLVTKKGTYQVKVLSATQITEKGRSGRQTVRSGDHVAVRGIVRGRSITAIWVHIYPVKPRPYDVRGTVRSVGSGRLTITTPAGTLTVAVDSGTVVEIGRSPGALTALRSGDQVTLRLVPGSPPRALSVRAAARKPGPHVRLSGTVAGVGGGQIVVRAGGRTYVVRIGSSRIYVGANQGSAASLHSGEAVIVYACCAGAALQATSIHIRRTAVHVATSTVRGQVIAIRGGAVTVRTGRGNVTVAVSSGTQVRVGLAPARASDIHVADVVSIRAHGAGGHLVAARVDISTAGRRLRHVRGTVMSASSGSVVVASRGVAVRVSVPSGTAVTLNGRRVALAALRRGDRVDLTARPGIDVLIAVSLTVKRAAPRSVTVRGTITQVGGGSVIITDASGVRHAVHLAPHTRILLGAGSAPHSALLVGVRASARGPLVAGVVQAGELRLETRLRTVSGRLTGQSRGWWTVRDRGRDVRVQVPAGLGGGVRVGSYVSIRGYVLAQGVRAVSIRTVAKSLTVSGTLTGSVLTTSAGDRYRLRLGTRTQIASQRTDVPLTSDEIPDGARVHVHGTVLADGTVRVDTLSVHLAAVNLRGNITGLGTGTWTVGTTRVRLLPAVVLAQGEHPLQPGDVVVGDDVTVYGYGARGVVLARKIVVHRRITTAEGTVASLTATGFTLTTPSGTVTVLVTAATVATVQPVVGVAVHVTGYLRGDGSILATRIRAVKVKRAWAASRGGVAWG